MEEDGGEGGIAVGGSWRGSGGVEKWGNFPVDDRSWPRRLVVGEIGIGVGMQREGKFVEESSPGRGK